MRFRIWDQTLFRFAGDVHHGKQDGIQTVADDATGPPKLMDDSSTSRCCQCRRGICGDEPPPPLPLPPEDKLPLLQLGLPLPPPPLPLPLLPDAI